ncbi:MAG: hypothetical protein KDE26_04880 [Bacteroidetes bacterium]|nr:hypothetical protein [Bacteroidota bacterium]
MLIQISFRSLIIILFCLFTLPVKAQFIATEQVFPVEGYSVFEAGYPVKIAPGTENKFVYLEFWAEGKEKRRIDNYYIQSYGIRDYVEHWFRPVTNEGFEPMEVKDLVRLEKSYAVIGLQFKEDDKTVHTVGRFYDLDGQSKTTEPVKISNFKKRPKKDYLEWLEVSPRTKYMVWMGQDFKKEINYVTVWNGDGDKVWEKEITIPNLNENYRVNELKIDDRGEVYFLLEPDVPFLNRREKKPIIMLRYQAEKETFLTEVVHVDEEADIMKSHFAFLRGGDIVIAGVLSKDEEEGIKNGSKLGTEGITRNWTHLFLKRYTRDKDNRDILTIKADSISAIPSGWIKQYEEEGSNFNLSELVVDEDYCALILEEHYKTKQKLYYYDLGCVGFDTKDGSVTWSRIINKRQRDSQSDAFMSYVSGVSRNRLRLVYLTERGAAGELLCTSIEMKTGKRKDKMLASNEATNYLFFPARSGMVSNFEMVLIGMGNPTQNDYSLITISF